MLWAMGSKGPGLPEKETKIGPNGETLPDGITWLPSGAYRWRVRVTYPDGTSDRLNKTARTKTAAVKARAKAKQEAEEGRRPVDSSLTIGEMVSEYMKGKEATWAPRTVWHNADMFQRHILPVLGHKRAAGVTPPDLRAYWESRKAAGLNESGQRHLYALLNGAYRRYIGDGILRDNPAAHARPAPPKRSGKLKAFQPEEADAFLAAALQDRWALPLAFMALTGMRIGEAVALRWHDITEDPKRPGVFLADVNKTRSEFKGKPYEGKPKTAAAERVFDLPPLALAIVQDMRRRVQIEAAAHGKGVGEYVFPSVSGEPMRHDTLRAVMERTCDRAGVPRLGPHGLRHTAASLALANGADVAAVSAALGHAQISTTLNIYRTPFERERRSVWVDMAAHALQAAKAEGAAEDPRPAKTESAAPKLRPKRRKGGPRHKK